jgi:hypothetical protein
VPPSSDIPVTRKIESADNFDELFAANYTALTRLIILRRGKGDQEASVVAQDTPEFARIHPPSQLRLMRRVSCTDADGQ